MKNALPIILFLILFFVDHLTVRVGVLPQVFSWATEVFIAIIFVIVLAKIISKRTFYIPIKYLLLFATFMYVVISGIILNEISTTTIIGGVRTYFKYIPLFLLPLAFDYTIQDLKKQFFVLIPLGLIQVPVSFWQKFVQFKGFHSGDVITGTLNISNSLSIILLSIILILVALYLAKKIPLKLALALSVVLFMPIGINETKITVIFLPFGLAAILFAMRKSLTLKQTGGIVSALAVFSFIFFFSYSLLYPASEELTKNHQDKPLLERLASYNLQGYKASQSTIFDITKNVVGEYKKLPEFRHRVGRFDGMLMPVQIFWQHDIVRFWFGFGIGNTSSAFGDGGNYLHIYELGGSVTTLTQLFWETGMLGAIFFVIFFLFIIKDSYALANKKSNFFIFAAGWTGVAVIQLLSLGYNNFFHFDEIAALFIYFSGIIVQKGYTTPGPDFRAST